eukprot:6587244-Prymnesium_polylepis.1
MFGSSAHLRRKPFAVWLLGSNQIEHMLSEWRAFVSSRATRPGRCSLCSTSFVAGSFRAACSPPQTFICRPWSQTAGTSARATAVRVARSMCTTDDYPTAAELLAMYAEVVAFVQEVLAALNMAAVLRDAGLWDEPPLEEWSRVQAAAAAEAERAAARATAAQFDGQAEEHEAGQEAAAMATELEGAEEDEAEEAATAAAAAVAAAAEAAAKATQPNWKPGERHAIAEIKGHANPGNRITFVLMDNDGNQTGSVEVTIKERYFHV